LTPTIFKPHLLYRHIYTDSKQNSKQDSTAGRQYTRQYMQKIQYSGCEATEKFRYSGSEKFQYSGSKIFRTWTSPYPRKFHEGI